MPYSPVNIKDVYARGGTLHDVWDEPFFHALRCWQQEYSDQKRNGLAPCPNRDHHEELERLLRETGAKPTDAHAAETLSDPAYTCGLVAYHREFDALTGDIWANHYVHRAGVQDETIVPLPEVPRPEEAEMLNETKDEPAEPVVVECA